MAKGAMLPMGIEDFARLREEGFYYIDKTKMIRDLLEHVSYVNLFTRPRRFGKTLNMSMLRCFFEPGRDAALFDGLEIAKETELCEIYMGKFPVISISLKDADGTIFDDAKHQLRFTVGMEALRFSFLAQSPQLTETERQQYNALIKVGADGSFTMSDELLKGSLRLLSQFLYQHYGQKTVILIDEYDVPLDKAYQAGYYDDMVMLIRSFFGQALKTNDCVFMAVLTGCLRVSKESIFTGFNNFSVYTVRDVSYNEYFGFTDAEVRGLLQDYGWMERYDAVKEWYDGYHFGELEIYCPWDVISYGHALRMNPAEKPKNYWVNTSGNDIIRRFIGMAGAGTRKELEQLIDGCSIKKMIRQELTYRDLDSDIDHLWSLLFTTGYLTQGGSEEEDGQIPLVIPNKEIRWIYVEQIRRWFKEETAKDTKTLEAFCQAFLEKNVSAIEAGFQAYLKKMISIRDTNVRNSMKENFYHGILLGLFANMADWEIWSNAESGEGYSDIRVETADGETGFVIELKYAENAALDAACETALRQIRDRNYEEALIDDGVKTIHRYGIACYKKRCRVVAG